MTPFPVTRSCASRRPSWWAGWRGYSTASRRRYSLSRWPPERSWSRCEERYRKVLCRRARRRKVGVRAPAGCTCRKVAFALTERWPKELTSSRCGDRVFDAEWGEPSVMTEGPVSFGSTPAGYAFLADMCVGASRTGGYARIRQAEGNPHEYHRMDHPRDCRSCDLGRCGVLLDEPPCQRAARS